MFLINGNTAQTSTWIEKGQIIDFVDDETNKPKVYEFKLKVLFEDESIALIYKPAGIIVSGNTFKTIANALPFNLQNSNLKDALYKPTPVHRLDNQTSGILIIAKTKTAQIELDIEFKNRTIQKTYHAIVLGNVLKNRTFKLPIEFKNAETSFEIIKKIPSLKYQFLTLLKVTPKTGRTHQIRIHLSEIGHPILGDKLYGNIETLHKGKGLFLSATGIKFKHPLTKKELECLIPVPHKFESLLYREEKRFKKYNAD